MLCPILPVILSIIYNDGANTKSVKVTTFYQIKKNKIIINTIPDVFSFTTGELTQSKFISNRKPSLWILFGSLSSFQHSEILPKSALSLHAIFPFSFLLPRIMFSLMYYWFAQLFTLTCLMWAEFNRLSNSL